MALGEVRLRDWWRVVHREFASGLTLGLMLGGIGYIRILLWQTLGWYDYGAHFQIVALTVACSLVGVVLFGTLAGSHVAIHSAIVEAGPPPALRPHSWQPLVGCDRAHHLFHGGQRHPCRYSAQIMSSN